MIRFTIIVLVLALAGSWLWFATATNERNQTTTFGSTNRKSDEIVVWVNEHLGSPDEAHYYAIAELWNTIEPDVKVKMCVLAYAGHESKLRVAIASGQPPDVCFLMPRCPKLIRILRTRIWCGDATLHPRRMNPFQQGLHLFHGVRMRRITREIVQFLWILFLIV